MRLLFIRHLRHWHCKVGQKITMSSQWSENSDFKKKGGHISKQPQKKKAVKWLWNLASPLLIIVVGNICIASSLNAKKTLILISTRWISVRLDRDVDDVAALTPRRMAPATTPGSIPPAPVQVFWVFTSRIKMGTGFNLNHKTDFRWGCAFLIEHLESLTYQHRLREWPRTWLRDFRSTQRCDSSVVQWYLHFFLHTHVKWLCRGTIRPGIYKRFLVPHLLHITQQKQRK